MRIRAADLRMLCLVSLMSAPPIAFMTFDFMFPNISTPSLDKEMVVVLSMSMLVGVPSGYFVRRFDLSMLSVLTYTAAGYILAVAYYSAPYTLYDIELILPSFYYALFFRFTVLLLFLFVLGGFVGVVFGQLLRDNIRREETKLTFPTREE